METLAVSEFKKNADTILARINNEHIRIIVTCGSGKSAVLMSQEDFQLIQNARPARSLSPEQQAARERSRKRMHQGYALGIAKNFRRDELYE